MATILTMQFLISMVLVLFYSNMVKPEPNLAPTPSNLPNIQPSDKFDFLTIQECTTSILSVKDCIIEVLTPFLPPGGLPGVGVPPGDGGGVPPGGGGDVPPGDGGGVPPGDGGGVPPGDGGGVPPGDGGGDVPPGGGGGVPPGDGGGVPPGNGGDLPPGGTTAAADDDGGILPGVGGGAPGVGGIPGIGNWFPGIGGGLPGIPGPRDFIKPSCCKAIIGIKANCWPIVFPNPFFPSLIEQICSAVK